MYQTLSSFRTVDGVTLYTIQVGEEEAFTPLATSPQRSTESPKHGVGRACQILLSAVPSLTPWACPPR